MTSQDRPGAPTPAAVPAPPTRSSSASVIAPAAEGVVEGGPATQRMPVSEYAGSFGGPTLAAPSTTVPRRPAPAVAAPTVRLGARRARLTIRRVDPWSVLKFTLLFSICMLVIGVVAVAALYYALDRLEVFDSIHTFVLELTQGGGATVDTRTGGIDVTFKPRWFIGGAAVLGGINTVIFTALATLGAFLYNLCSDIVGGIEVVLGEDD